MEAWRQYQLGAVARAVAVRTGPSYFTLLHATRSSGAAFQELLNIEAKPSYDDKVTAYLDKQNCSGGNPHEIQRKAPQLCQK